MNAIIKKTKKITKNKNLWPVFFIGPHLLIFLVFTLVPFAYGILISFTEWDLFTEPIFVGLENFRTILFNSDSSFYFQFWNGLKNTFIFVLLTVPLSIIVPLILATILSMKPKFHRFFQAIFYLPTLFAISAVMIIWSFLLSVSYGPLNQIFDIGFNVLQTQPYAWISLVLVTVWWTIGGNLIIYTAAINGISKDILEAAEIDGAGPVRKLFSIILPNMKFQILYTTIMTTIAQFNVYGQPLMLTNGGPGKSTTVLLMEIQQNAFSSGGSRAGIASAMAVMLGLCIMVVSIGQIYLLRDKD